MKYDERGSRMKEYEADTALVLPPRTNTIIRVDGKAFHTFTRGLDRPFDERLIGAMDETARWMCRSMSGAVCAYVQSDEISVILADYANENTQPWLGGVVQKIASISASMATAEFNRLFVHHNEMTRAMFDGRVFSIDALSEVNEYLLWRQIDAKRNAVSSVATHVFGHKAIVGKNTKERTQMLKDNGVMLKDFPAGNIFGRFIFPEIEVADVVYRRRDRDELELMENVERKVWKVVPAPDFRNYTALFDLFPVGEEEYL